MARFEADSGDRVHLTVATTCAPIRCPSRSWALDTDKRSEPTEVSLLDPFVFGSAQMVGVLRHQRENGLAVVFGNARCPEHRGRWHC